MASNFEKCKGCDATTDLVYFCIPIKGTPYALCHGCKGAGFTAIPDVWYGYGSGEHSEENIAYPNGHPQAGQPIPFHDKRSKAMAMKIAGVREAGDRIRGVRNEDMVPQNRKKYFT